MKDVLRILVIGMHDKIGGVETFLMNYYRNINRDLIQFDFVNMYDKLCFQDEIQKLGGKIYNVANVKKHPVQYYKEIKKIIKDNKYDIVHINMLSAANVVPVIVAKRLKVKHVIVHSHNSNTPDGFLRKIMHEVNKKILNNSATEYWACSNLAGEWLYGKEKNFKVINNAVDVKKYEFDENIRNEIRKELNVEDKFLIGHIGRFSFQKNHEFLIDLFYELQKKRNDAVLLLIGEGELQEEIQNKVKELHIEDKVIFLGTTNEVYKYMQAMDVFVLPSRFEGLPVTGIEAQANGLISVFSENISEEVLINKNAIRLPLNINKWVEFLSDIDNDRCVNEDNKVVIEYDIYKKSKELEQIYINWQ